MNLEIRIEVRLRPDESDRRFMRCGETYVATNSAGTFAAWGALTRSQSEGCALPARPIKYHLEVVAKTR